MVTINTVEVKKNQLRWQCLRGMLEIDLLLNRYLSTCYSNAPEAERSLFEELLTENDQQLFLWLTGQEQMALKYSDLLTKMLKKSS